METDATMHNPDLQINMLSCVSLQDGERDSLAGLEDC